LREHIRATLDAIERGVPVDAYFAWSLLDNFEWSSGYAKRFGLIYVDYDTLHRIPKRSAKWYGQFLKG
jgi:beta-glucosidase